MAISGILTTSKIATKRFTEFLFFAILRLKLLVSTAQGARYLTVLVHKTRIDFLLSYGSVRVGSESRQALHPCDSLSSPLSVGHCPAVAQEQSRKVLAEAAGGSGDKREAREGAGQQRRRRRRQRSLAAASSRDAQGRCGLDMSAET